MDKNIIEEELADLIRKYSDEMTAGEVTEKIIGFMTCACFSVAKRIGEDDVVENDLINIVKNNIDKSKRFF